MKKILSFVLCCILMLGTLTNCGSKSSKDTTETEAPVEQKKDKPKGSHVKLAEETNKTLPMVLPGGIRYDKAEALSNNEFRFIYTFTQAPAVSVEEFERNIKPTLTLGLQQTKTPDMEMFRKDKTTLIYAYYTMDGKLFSEVRLSPKEYTSK